MCFILEEDFVRISFFSKFAMSYLETGEAHVIAIAAVGLYWPIVLKRTMKRQQFSLFVRYDSTKIEKSAFCF